MTSRFRNAHQINRHELLKRLGTLDTAQQNREAVDKLINTKLADDCTDDDCPDPPDDCPPIPTAEELATKRKELEVLSSCVRTTEAAAHGWAQVAIRKCFEDSCATECYTLLQAVLNYDCMLARAHEKECAAELCRMEFACIGCTGEELVEMAKQQCGSLTGPVRYYVNQVI